MFETVEIKDVKAALGLLVKTLRKRQGLSQKELATSLDVSRTTIRNLENGKNFTVDTILKVFREINLLEKLNAEIVKAQSQAENYKNVAPEKGQITDAKSLY